MGGCLMVGTMVGLMVGKDRVNGGYWWLMVGLMIRLVVVNDA